MLLKKIINILKRKIRAVTVAVLVCAVLLSTVTVLSFVSIAEGDTYVAKLNYSGGGTYIQNEISLGVGVYQLDVDYRLAGSATRPYAKINNSGGQITRNILTEENGHYTARFTVETAGAHNVFLAEYNISGIIYFENPVLKKVENGELTGDNLLWDFSKQYENVGATVTTAYAWGGQWYKSSAAGNFTIEKSSTMPATADPTAPATKMIHVDNGADGVGYFTYLWRPIETDGIVNPNTKYRVSFIWESISNAAIDGSVPLFYANYYNGTSWDNKLFKANDLSAGAATDKALYKTNLAHGQRIDIDFTTPADCASGGSICFVIGDAGWNIDKKRVTFNMADTKFYTRDGSDNLTEIPTTDISVNETLGTFSSTIETTVPGLLCERSGSYPRPGYLTFVDIPEDYFTELKLITDPTAPATKMIHVDNDANGVGYFTYLWRPIETDGIVNPNTRYRVSFIWENISNAAIDGSVPFLYANYYNGTSWDNKLFKTNDLSAGAATDKALYKTNLAHGQRIDIDFTTPADCASGGSICFVIGDAGWNIDKKRVTFNMADTKFYTRDGSDNLTEIPTTDISVNETLGTFSSTIETTVPGLLCERSGSYPRPGYLTFVDIPEDYFTELKLITDPTAPATKMIHVDNGANGVGYFTYLWRPIETAGIVKPNTKYRFSFAWENVSNAAIDGSVPFLYANYYDGADWNNLLFKANDLSVGTATDKALYKTDLAHGQRIEIDFTTPADCASGGSICFVIGDAGWNIDKKRVTFNMADTKFYTRDGSDNLTEIPTTDIGVNETLGTFSSTIETTVPGLLCERSGSYPRPGYLTFDSIPADYFKPQYGAYTTGTTGKLTTDVSLSPNTKYILRFGSKYYEDAKAKPYVELKTASGTVTEIGDFSNNIGGQYNTVYEFKTPANLSEGVNATVGVNIDSAAINGVFSLFELYELTEDGGETGDNLILDPLLTEAQTEATIWEAEGVIFKTVDIDRFRIPDPKMLIFSGMNGGNTHIGSDGKVEYPGNYYAHLENNATLENGKKYIFSVNYKFAGTGYSPEKHDLSDEIGPRIYLNKADGGFTQITEGKTENSEEYKVTYIFTAADLVERDNNFRFRFNVVGAFTSGYLANAELYAYNGTKAVGEQLLKNGDFSTGDATGWTVSNRNYFYNFTFVDIPENFFTKEGAKPNMIAFRNSTDYYRYEQHIMVKPYTNYQLEYQLKITNYNKADDAKPAVAFYVDLFSKNDEGEYMMKSDGINVDSSNIPIPAENKLGYTQKGGNYVLKLRTDELRTIGVGNCYLRLYLRTGSAGYWGKVALYELDENGKKTGNNIVLNGDFSCGLAAWSPIGQVSDRIVQQPDNFFAKAEESTPDKMIYSNGSVSNATYGNTFRLKPGQKYYFSGTYVNMNGVGLTPEILYIPTNSKNGKYQKLDTEFFYDPDRYYFEVAFTVPDDSLIDDGLTSIKVQINNNNKGKGYFTNLSLTEDGYFENLFDKSGFAGQSLNYQKMPYNKNVFVFYYDDSAFDDGNWSGEAILITDSIVKGLVMDDDGNPLSGVRMLLSPGYSATTDGNGEYRFDGVASGQYTLYLIDPTTLKQVFCMDITVEKGKEVLLPVITGTKTLDEMEVEVGEEIEVRDRATLQGLVLDKNGKRLAGVPIYVEDNGYRVTDENGIFTFNNITEFGEKKVYMYLENGSKYVFRTVKLEAGKGLKIKLKYLPESKSEEGLSLWVIAVICAAGTVLLAGGVFLLIFLLRKKRKVKSE